LHNNAAICRLLIDSPRSGPWNMAVDELLLDSTARDGCCVLRFYHWIEPTLSLGYFQSYNERQTHEYSQSCPAVRRLTGGGAIVHDCELTYSLAVPAGHPLAAGRELFYETVHAALIDALSDYGLSPTICRGNLRSDETGERFPVADSPAEPFLCFQRRSPGDVLLGQYKIAGSAQRRRRGAVLQHGSVLLKRSAAAPELPGLEDLAETSFLSASLAEKWLDKLARGLDVRWQSEGLTAAEERRAAEVAEGRYSCDGWTVARRDPLRAIATL
jgi:lipoate-protein ligase A